MKLILINPRDNNSSVHPLLNDYVEKHPAAFVIAHPSLPLLTVSALTPAGVDVEYVDENIREIDFDAAADIIGIGGMTQQATRAYEIADEFQRRGKKVVIGGIHATLLPKEAKRHADWVIVGEAEAVWKTFVKDFRRGKSKEFYEGGIADLAKSPTPRYDLAAGFNFKGTQPLIPIQVSRGCPHNCSFCTVTHVYGRKYRTKTVPQVVREIESILENCRFENMLIKFNDDNPFVNPKFSKAMLKAIELLKIKWFALADIAIAGQSDVLNLLRKAGCLCLGIGFESMDPCVLGEISRWKEKYLNTYGEAVRKINEHGILVAGSFMFGFDHDTKDSFERVRDFVLENRVMSKYSIVTPFPGTRLYDDLKKEGRLIENMEWKHYNFLNVVYKTKMPAEEIVKNLRHLYEETWNPLAIGEINKFNTQVISRHKGYCCS